MALPSRTQGCGNLLRGSVPLLSRSNATRSPYYQLLVYTVECNEASHIDGVLSIQSSPQLLKNNPELVILRQARFEGKGGIADVPTASLKTARWPPEQRDSPNTGALLVPGPRPFMSTLAAGSPCDKIGDPLGT